MDTTHENSEPPTRWLIDYRVCSRKFRTISVIHPFPFVRDHSMREMSRTLDLKRGDLKKLMREQINELHTENETLKERYAELERDLEDSSSQALLFQEISDSTQKELEQSKEEAERLEQINEQLEEKVMRLKASQHVRDQEFRHIGEMKSKIAEYESERTRLQDSVRDFRKRFQESRDSASELSRENRQLRAQVSSEKERCRASIDLTRRLQSDKEDLQSDLEKQFASLSAFRASSSIDSKRERRRRLDSQRLAAIRSQLLDFRDFYDETLTLFKASLQGFWVEFTSFSSDLEEAVEQNRFRPDTTDAEARAQVAEEKREVLEREARDLRDEVDGLQDQLSKAEKRIQFLETQDSIVAVDTQPIEPIHEYSEDDAISVNSRKGDLEPLGYGVTEDDAFYYCCQYDPLGCCAIERGMVEYSTECGSCFRFLMLLIMLPWMIIPPLGVYMCNFIAYYFHVDGCDCKRSYDRWNHHKVARAGILTAFLYLPGLIYALCCWGALLCVQTPCYRSCSGYDKDGYQKI